MPFAAAARASPRSASRTALAPLSVSGFAARFNRVAEAAEPHIDWSDQLPACAIGGIAGEVLLNLADEGGDRLRALRFLDAGESGMRGDVGRAERHVEARRPERQNHQCRYRGGAAPPLRHCRGRRRSAGVARLRVRCGEEPARNFKARRFRFRLADQAGRAIAIDFLQLILVDHQIAAAGRGAR